MCSLLYSSLPLSLNLNVNMKRSTISTNPKHITKRQRSTGQLNMANDHDFEAPTQAPTPTDHDTAPETATETAITDAYTDAYNTDLDGHTGTENTTIINGIEPPMTTITTEVDFGIKILNCHSQVGGMLGFLWWNCDLEPSMVDICDLEPSMVTIPLESKVGLNLTTVPSPWPRFENPSEDPFKMHQEVWKNVQQLVVDHSYNSTPMSIRKFIMEHGTIFQSALGNELSEISNTIIESHKVKFILAVLSRYLIIYTQYIIIAATKDHADGLTIRWDLIISLARSKISKRFQDICYFDPHRLPFLLLLQIFQWTESDCIYTYRYSFRPTIPNSVHLLPVLERNGKIEDNKEHIIRSTQSLLFFEFP